MAEHILTITEHEHGNTLHIACPGIEAGGCEGVTECLEDACTAFAEGDNDARSTAHGVEHRRWDGLRDWYVPSGRCGVLDWPGLREEVTSMFEDLHGMPVAAGVWRVVHAWDDGLRLMFAGDTPEESRVVESEAAGV